MHVSVVMELILTWLRL